MNMTFRNLEDATRPRCQKQRQMCFIVSSSHGIARSSLAFSGGFLTGWQMNAWQTTSADPRLPPSLV